MINARIPVPVNQRWGKYRGNGGADGGGLSVGSNVNYARSGDVIPGMCALPAELRDAQVEVP